MISGAEWEIWSQIGNQTAVEWKIRCALMFRAMQGESDPKRLLYFLGMSAWSAEDRKDKLDIALDYYELSRGLDPQACSNFVEYGYGDIDHVLCALYEMEFLREHTSYQDDIKKLGPVTGLKRDEIKKKAITDLLIKWPGVYEDQDFPCGNRIDPEIRQLLDCAFGFKGPKELTFSDLTVERRDAVIQLAERMKLKFTVISDSSITVLADKWEPELERDDDSDEPASPATEVAPANGVIVNAQNTVSRQDSVADESSSLKRESTDESNETWSKRPCPWLDPANV